MNVQLMASTRAALTLVDASLAAPSSIVLRSGTRADADALHALIRDHQAEGHLLPRTREELESRAPRFVVAIAVGQVVGCAELASLSTRTAEVRSLVVHPEARHDGVGRRLVDEIVRRSIVQGFDRLTAFTYSPGYFMRMGFSLVPHHWVPEKIAADCRSCGLFRRCGQHAVVLTLADSARAESVVRS